METIKGIIFDLDDTLYLEKDYVQSGFVHVSKKISSVTLISEAYLFEFMWKSFLSGDRRGVFDRILEENQEVKKYFNIYDLVCEYRGHAPNISLKKEVNDLLLFLKKRKILLGIISDGFLESQRNKIYALGLKKIFDKIILTDEYGVEYWKPNERAFVEMEKYFCINPENFIYIADNPKKDFIAPSKRGWKTLRCIQEGQLYEFDKNNYGIDIDFTIHGFFELSSFIKRSVG